MCVDFNNGIVLNDTKALLARYIYVYIQQLCVYLHITKVNKWLPKINNSELP